jgi:hypothetical protein
VFCKGKQKQELLNNDSVSIPGEGKCFVKAKLVFTQGGKMDEFPSPVRGSVL